MEKCSDACGDAEYDFRSGHCASLGASVSEASIPLTGSRWDTRWLSGRVSGVGRFWGALVQCFDGGPHRFRTKINLKNILLHTT
jgi:hypothetical protein